MILVAPKMHEMGITHVAGIPFSYIYVYLQFELSGEGCNSGTLKLLMTYLYINPPWLYDILIKWLAFLSNICTLSSMA
ncbi:hypothetical protein SUGI_0451540 [Cryptomeria japonica]|nr:hypothetical protein SUGI_0451540 [Cryptomeria japonica]